MTTQEHGVGTGGASPKSRLPSWVDFRKAITVKTAYLATLVLAAGIALISLSIPMHGTSQLLLLALGSTLTTSSVFSVISEAMVRLDTLAEVHSEIDNLRSAIHAAAGIEKGTHQFQTRRQVNFENFLATARGTIRVVAFSANDLLSAPNCDQIYDALANGQLKSLQVLLLDPASPEARVRSSLPAYHSTNALMDKSRAVLSELESLQRRLQKDGKNDLVVWWLITEPITVSLVADDTVAIVTPVIRTKTGGTSPTFMFSRQSESAALYDAYIEYFESLRKDFGN